MRGLTVAGSGPSVLFATGLYNTMPSTAYSDILRILRRNLTVWCYDTQRPLDAISLKRISKYTGIENFGYIGHSSFSSTLFDSNEINQFVLLDPAIFPSGFNPTTKKMIKNDYVITKPMILLHAEYTYASPIPFIPQAFRPSIKNVDAQYFDKVGHADILDDPFADICHSIGIRGHTPQHSSKITRALYREKLSQKITDFLVCSNREKKNKHLL